MASRTLTVGCCLALSIQPMAAVVAASAPLTGPSVLVPGGGGPDDASPGGLSLDVSTLIAGSDDDAATAVTFDPEGNIVVAGTTRSWGELGAEGGRYGPGGGRDVFVARLRGGDGSLLWVSYLGGGADDRAWAVRADASGVYVVGETDSVDFPTRGGAQGALAGSSDCFIAKLASDGGTLLYSTYYGAEGADRGFGLAVDGLGAAYVAGQFDNGVDFDGLLVKMAPDGGSVEYAVLLTTPGWGNEYARAVAVDAAHCAYVTGGSSGAGSDVFVVKADPSGTDALYSRTLGGSAYDIGLAIVVDSAGAASVAGETDSPNFTPLVSPMQESSAGSPDGFIATLDPEGRVLFSTYLGGIGGEGITGLALDASGALVLSGDTNSEDLPLVAPLQDRLGGSEDAWVARLDPQAGALRISLFAADGRQLGTTRAVDHRRRGWS